MRRVLVALGVSYLLFGEASAAETNLSSFAADGYAQIDNCRYDPVWDDCMSQGQTWLHVPATRWSTGAAASASDPRGSSWATAAADTGSYLPLLKAYSSSNGAWGNAGDATWAEADIWAVQGYRYTGSVPFTLTVNARLDASITSIPGAENPAYGTAAISIFPTTGYTFEWSQESAAGGVCNIFLTPSWPNCANMSEVFDQHGDELYDTGSFELMVSHRIQPGETFYVGAYLSVYGCCGASVDASQTLTMQFNDATFLEDYPVTLVPEPGMWAMLLAGLIGFALSRYRRFPFLAGLDSGTERYSVKHGAGNSPGRWYEHA